MLIADKESGGYGIDSFVDMGLVQSTSSVGDELVAFRSPALMTEVVKRLGINTTYSIVGQFYDEIAYGKNLPVSVNINNLVPIDNNVGFTIQIRGGGIVALSDFVRDGESIDVNEVEGKLLDSISTPLGKLVVIPNEYYRSDSVYVLDILQNSICQTVEDYIKKLNVSLDEDGIRVINTSLQDNSIQRAEDVINTLIEVYNENWIEDKNQIAVSTNELIDERLAVIEYELADVDKSIAVYKSKNLAPDLSMASNMYLEQSSANNAQLLDLEIQLSVINYIYEYLFSDVNKEQLLPAIDIGNPNIGALIEEYNKQILERNRLGANSGSVNPLVADKDKALLDMRNAIAQTVENELKSLNAKRKNIQVEEIKTTTRIANTPTQATRLLAIERQQTIKESLYLFLLQKREENELSRAFTAYNTRIIAPPHGSNQPIAPASNSILIVAFIIGLAVQTMFLFAMERMNTRLRGRKDLDGFIVPLTW